MNEFVAARMNSGFFKSYDNQRWFKPLSSSSTLWSKLAVELLPVWSHLDEKFATFGQTDSQVSFGYTGTDRFQCAVGQIRRKKCPLLGGFEPTISRAMAPTTTTTIAHLINRLSSPWPLIQLTLFPRQWAQICIFQRQIWPMMDLKSLSDLFDAHQIILIITVDKHKTQFRVLKPKPFL